MDISRRLVWLAFAIALLDVIDGQWLAAISELLAEWLAEVEWPSRFCASRFLQPFRPLLSQ